MIQTQDSESYERMKMNETSFENELEFYRKNYFLDPKGSNADLFMESVNSTLKNLLEMYTGRKLDVKVSFSDKGNIKEARVKDALNDKQIIEKLVGISGTVEMPECHQPLDKGIKDLAYLLESEVCFNAEFLGQMHPHDNIPSFIGGIAGKFLNGNTIAKEVSRVTTYMEKQVIAWLANEFGYNPDSSWMVALEQDKLKNETKEDLEKMVNASGNITVGGTTANLAALLVARNKAYGKKDKQDVGGAETGLSKKQEGVVIGSELAHYSIEKLCGYIGIGSDNFKKAKTIGKKMMAGDNREGSIKNLMWNSAQEGQKVIAVVATAGLTETGNIDDLEGIGKLIDQFEKEFGYKPHFHVDAAHGGGFIMHEKFNPKKGGLFKGIEKADSITIDPHKMLYTHYSAGAILFKDSKDHSLLKQSASYLFKSGEDHNLGQYRVEGSMGLEGALQTWMSLFTIGKKGYQAIQENALQMTQYLASKVSKEDGFELLHQPEMNLLCFRYNNSALTPEQNDAINKKAQQIMYDRGIAYISNETQLHRSNEHDEGKKIESFRAVVMHPYTGKKEIDVAVEEVKKGVAQALKGYMKQTQ
jgi:glutamate/tyrosine decarboxylase-like PLP-dependent enzyme